MPQCPSELKGEHSCHLPAYTEKNGCVQVLAVASAPTAAWTDCKVQGQEGQRNLRKWSQSTGTAGCLLDLAQKDNHGQWTSRKGFRMTGIREGKCRGDGEIYVDKWRGGGSSWQRWIGSIKGESERPFCELCLEEINGQRAAPGLVYHFTPCLWSCVSLKPSQECSCGRCFPPAGTYGDSARSEPEGGRQFC